MGPFACPGGVDLGCLPSDQKQDLAAQCLAFDHVKQPQNDDSFWGIPSGKLT